MVASSSTRIAKNTAFLYTRMLVVMLINIFSVRFVLKGLGVVDYGVFNVVAGLVTMFSSLSSIISSATQRFYSYAIGEGKEEKVSDIFTASFNIYALLSLIVLVLGEAIGVWFINTKMDLPLDRLAAANWIFQFAIIEFIVGLLMSPFMAHVFAYERMSVFSVISVSECILKFILALSLLHLSFDRLVFYGVGLLCIRVIVFSAYYFSAHHASRELSYKKKADKSLYREILSFSGWTLLSSSAGIGISQLVTMITNVFFGPVVNAARAIAFQVNGALSSFTNNIIMAIKPPMIKTYAEGDYKKVNTYFNFSNKAIYYSLLIIVIPLYFEMGTILKIWLDVNDAQTVLFCRLILINVLLLSLNNPIAIIIQANGNIKAYSTFVEIPTLLVFPITWALYSFGLPAQTAFYVMIAAVICSHVIRLICLKALFPIFSYKQYAFSFMFPAAIVTLLSVFLAYFIHYQLSNSLATLFVICIVSVITIFGLCFIIGFTREERQFLLSAISKVFSGRTQRV